MANVYCTKKLEKILGKNHLCAEPGEHLLGNWNANVFYLQRRKCLILTNDETYYSLLFLNLRKADMLRMQEMFYERLVEQLDFDQLHTPLSCASMLLSESETRFLPTNGNRRVLGMMNEFVAQTEYRFYYNYDGDFSKVRLTEMNHQLNNYLVGALGNTRYDYGNPIAEMRKKLDFLCEEVEKKRNEE